MKFKQLSIGQSFDFINDEKPSYNSFFKKCIKISPRKYTDSDGMTHSVGSINANVFHAGN